MQNPKVKLKVNDLKISFRTNHGRVQAVRNISFDLYEGETLAIVGESGSGKSVTSRAIMGILAPNGIVESGEILYDGKDLLQLSEEDFHALRGDQLAMVFQDPLSSLNPIVKIGKQMTEAMLYKNKAVRRESRKKLSAAFQILAENIDEVTSARKHLEIRQKNKKNIQILKRFVHQAILFQNAYNLALQNIEDALLELEECETHLKKNVMTNVSKMIIHAALFLKNAQHPQLLPSEHPIYQHLEQLIKRAQSKEPLESSSLLPMVTKMIELIRQLKEIPELNCFGLGYYALDHKEIPKLPIPELNRLTHAYLDEHFMLEYIEDLMKGVQYAFSSRNELKKEAILKLKAAYERIEAMPVLEKKEMDAIFKELFVDMKKIQNPLRIGKEPFTATFQASIEKQLAIYYRTDKVNMKNKRAYEREKKRWERLVQRDKKTPYTVPEPYFLNPSVLKKNIERIIQKLIETYEEEVKGYLEFDVHSYTISIIDYLKELSFKTVYRVTKRSAKEEALRLMNEVGIPEPKKRFDQYPFQFSGGMRQRIVIAIALSANPDILICDEPTTALDVTIQGQILELINQIKKKRKLSIIFITHDLGVVANMADRIAVMYAGKIVEYGTVEDVFYDPKHPYTWALLASMPDLETKDKLSSIPGTPPNMIDPPKGDAFAARNQYAMQIDFKYEPPLFQVSDTHYAATWLLHPKAPKVRPPAIVTNRIQRRNPKEAMSNGK